MIRQRSRILRTQSEKPYRPPLDLARNWREVLPEEKVRIIQEMGFTPMRETHQPDCPVTLGGNGLRCNCAPDPTYWSPPDDVLEFRHETWSERLALRRKQQEKE